MNGSWKTLGTRVLAVVGYLAAAACQLPADSTAPVGTPGQSFHQGLGKR